MFDLADLAQDENQVMELLRPEWDNNGPKGLEFAVRFDMQLQVLRDLLWAHGLPCDLRTQSTARLYQH
jgi:hypothetical protein